MDRSALQKIWPVWRNISVAYKVYDKTLLVFCLMISNSARCQRNSCRILRINCFKLKEHKRNLRRILLINKLRNKSYRCEIFIQIGFISRIT